MGSNPIPRTRQRRRHAQKTGRGSHPRRPGPRQRLEIHLDGLDLVRRWSPTLEVERAETCILEQYKEYSCATSYHVLFTLMWRTGLNIDEIHALDHHRGKWRHDVTDEYDRDPLLTTGEGRPTRSLVEVTVHSPTRPCIYERRCPHDRDPDECAATQGVVSARKCPSSFGPTVVRRSTATRWLSEGVPKEVVSERMNVSEDELNQHYDERTPTERMEQRREHFD